MSVPRRRRARPYYAARTWDDDACEFIRSAPTRSKWKARDRARAFSRGHGHAELFELATADGTVGKIIGVWENGKEVGRG